MARNSAAGIPAAQDKFHPGLDRVAVVRRMRVVHRHDVGRDRRPDRVVVIGDDANSARAFDQKARMAEKGDRDRALRSGGSEAHWPGPPATTPVHAACAADAKVIGARSRTMHDP